MSPHTIVATTTSRASALFCMNLCIIVKTMAAVWAGYLRCTATSLLSTVALETVREKTNREGALSLVERGAIAKASAADTIRWCFLMR